MHYALTPILICILLTACSPREASPSRHSNVAMRAEFLDHCQNRPEYASRKRAGTLDTYCLCVFDKTMKNLTEDERIVAGFYLYGETAQGYQSRYPVDVQDAMNSMITASQAIDKAVKSCR